jgi:hypothetical protein
MTVVSRAWHANWALALGGNPVVLMFPMLTTAGEPIRFPIQVVRNQVAHVAELADALDSGSSE